MKTIKGNVIQDQTFKNRVRSVLDYVATNVASTLGPFGHNAMIQTTDRVIITKDGWNVLRNISFDNTIDNSIKSLIETVAHSVVLHVGDGSTTATYAASELLKYLSYNETVSSIPIRDFETLLVKCVDAVEVNLRKNAVQIDDENMGEMIRKVALVSSNWNDDFANMISEIYVKTRNPIIKIQNSGTEKTFVEYVDGYDLSGKLMLNAYINNTSNSRCELENPAILVFGYKPNFKPQHIHGLIYLATALLARNQPLVVMAPEFEKSFIDTLHALNLNSIRNGKSIVNIIPVMYNNKFNIDRECVSDFTTLVNAKIVTLDDDNFTDLLTDVDSVMTKTPADDDDVDECKNEQTFTINSAIQYLNDNYFGTCGKVFINDRGILVSDIQMSDSVREAIQHRKESVEAEIIAKTKECDALTMITDDIRVKRIRLGKLQCHMGIINIGGYGDADLKAKKDSLEDTTRACEAAFRDGVSIGSSINIIRAINEGITTELLAHMDEDDPHYNIITNMQSELLTSFIAVVEKLFLNMDENYDIDEIHKIINNCEVNGWGYNLLTRDYDKDFTVINPVNVDIEVVRATLKLVLICMTSDKFIFKWYDNMDVFDDVASNAGKNIDQKTQEILERTIRK